MAFYFFATFIRRAYCLATIVQFYEAEVLVFIIQSNMCEKQEVSGKFTLGKGLEFCQFYNFDFPNLKITCVKKPIGTETSDLQVKFHSRVAFQICIFNNITISCYI